VGEMVAAATHPTVQHGAHSELALVAESAVARLPPGADPVQAAALPFASLTAWKALRGHAAVRPGQSVLVHGATGSVGGFALQYLRHLGCRWVGVFPIGSTPCAPPSLTGIHLHGACSCREPELETAGASVVATCKPGVAHEGRARELGADLVCVQLLPPPPNPPASLRLRLPAG
jgi:hypothetical protein